MAHISLDSIEFYKPTPQACKPRPSAQTTQPALSTATVTANDTGPAGQKAQTVKARPRNGGAPTTGTETGSLRVASEDADPFDELSASAGIEREQSKDDTGGTVLTLQPRFRDLTCTGAWIDVDNIVLPSCSDDADADCLRTVEELLFSDGKDSTWLPGCDFSCYRF